MSTPATSAAPETNNYKNLPIDAVIQCLEKEIKDLDETWTGLHSNPALASARISFTESANGT